MRLIEADMPAASPEAAPPPPLRLVSGACAEDLPPVVLLGGEANALSVSRDLSRMGVKVYAIGTADTCLRYSRHCKLIVPPSQGDPEQTWAQFLLGPQSDHFRGAVLLACCDEGLQVLARHREPLQQRFLLDEADPGAQLAMLDKLQTYQHASAAKIATPQYWPVESRQQILDHREQLLFPLLAKPRLSHLFERQFGQKFIIANNLEELLDAYRVIEGRGIRVLLVEWIPGPDDQLASYFTYVDARGKLLFNYTKRVIRRYPVGMGAGCYHITDWVPQLIEPSRRLIEQASLRGLVNIEFKFDQRDQQYKLMECNARFTASNSLISASGLPLAPFIYNRIIGRPQLLRQVFRLNMRMWDPVRDFAAFLELRRRRQMTFGQWLASVMYPQTLPYFRWSDPGPTLARALRPLRRMLRRSAK